MLYERRRMRKVMVDGAVVAGLMTMVILLVPGSVAVAQEEEAVGSAGAAGVAGWAFMAAAISAGLGCLGAGIAVAYVGAAAVGAVAEKPELAARSLIFVGLAEGIAIYGLIIAIMILGKV